jgi:S1-C subfamily serine protease
VIWSHDGLVVTAHHVVERDDDITVGLANGDAMAAELVGRDPSSDLAVLRVLGPAQDLTPLAWADADGLAVGHLILALGRPNSSVQATLGVVSALDGSWRTRGGGQIDTYLQTDVVMYPGFSGGPLIDSSGRAVGINTSALLRGVSLTVPTATIRRVVTAVVTHGQVRRGYLGVGIQPVRLPAVVAERLEQETGLLLVSVEQSSPADHGGLFMGDTIVSFAEQPVRHHDDLLSCLSGDLIGTTVTVDVLRGGQMQAVEVVIGERK